jgi:alanyl-tRNA synthetase
VRELEAGGAAPHAGIQVEQVGRWRLVYRVVDDVSSVEELREIADVLEEMQRPAAVLVASGNPALPLLVTKVSESYHADGLDAAELARTAGGAIGGRGGGRPTFGQAGGIDAARIPEAVSAAHSWLEGRT